MDEGATPKQRRMSGNMETDFEENDEILEDDAVQTMSEAANKEIRDKYRDLIQTVQEQADGAGEAGVDISSLRFMVLKANETFLGVKRPREAVMDSQFLKTCGTLAKMNIESAQSNLTVFRPSEFAQKLIHFMTPDDEADDPDDAHDQPEWQRFGKAVSSLYKRTVGVEPFCGAMEWHRPHPKSAPRVRNQEKDSEIAPRTKPTEVLVPATGEERQTEEVTRIFKILKARYKENGNHPLCFYTFVVNPHSYPLTTENLFHTSFLLREQFAVVTEDENGLPVILPRSLTVAPRTGGISYQCLISLTKRDWRNIVDTFKIKDTMITPPANRLYKRKS